VGGVSRGDTVGFPDIHLVTLLQVSPSIERVYVLLLTHVP
jgi:hypothetical protein